MRVTNRSGQPSWVVKRWERAWRQAQEDYDGPKGPGIITVTQLISPAQQLQLMRRHGADLEIDVLDLVPLLRGTAIHLMLERAAEGDPNFVAERRMDAFHDGWLVSGGLDLYVVDEAHLIDTKDSSVWAFIFGKPEWIAQVNVNAWILRRNGIPVKALSVELSPRDWRTGEARKMADYPTTIQVIPAPMWSDEEQTAYVDRRLALHRQDLPPCSPEERWAKPDSWAIRKEGAKKARAVYAVEADAAGDLRGGEIVEYRPGESVRCSGYCLARPFCTQAAKDPTLNREED